jgi:hypothetical protein
MRALRKCLFSYSAALIASVSLAIAPAWAGEANISETKAKIGRLVVVGDSLSAGFQNFSLYDSDSVAPPGGQKHGFAELIAHQANVSLRLPLIQYPGIPPALILEGKEITRAQGFGTREPQTLPVQTLNLSVPGFDVVDSLVHKVNLPEVKKNPQAASSEDLLAVEILGYPSLFEKPSSRCGVFALPNGEVLFSEAACAIKLRPNTILISIGNDDALQSLTLGIPPTDVAHFSKYYQILLGALSRYTSAKIFVSNIPNVTDVPFLVSYPEFEARCGVPPTGAGPNDYVVPNLAAPTFDICTNYVVRTAALIAQAQTATHDYNLIIAATAAKSHAVVVDVNTLFAHIAKHGYKTGEHQLTAQYLGGIFSLDAVHPANTGYAILANAFIDRMNCELHANIPLVNIEQIADTDPLVLSNPGK